MQLRHELKEGREEQIKNSASVKLLKSMPSTSVVVCLLQFFIKAYIYMNSSYSIWFSASFFFSLGQNITQP